MPRAKVTKKAGNGTSTSRAASAKAGSKKTTKRKTAASTRSKTTTTRKRTTRKRAPARQSDILISSDERRRLIAEAAYLRAEARGFGGDTTRDWLEAESEIDSRFAHA